MTPRAKVTTLYTFPRTKQCEWIDSTGTRNVYPSACAVVADWAGVSSDEIDTDDNDFITVDGDPVAFLETKWVPIEAPAPLLLAAE